MNGEECARIREEVTIAAFEIISEHFLKRGWAKHTKLFRAVIF
jgi:hypothetical protein